MMTSDSLPNLYELQQQFEAKESTIPAIEVNQPPAASYDALLVMDTQGVH